MINNDSRWWYKCYKLFLSVLGWCLVFYSVEIFIWKLLIYRIILFSCEIFHRFIGAFARHTPLQLYIKQNKNCSDKQNKKNYFIFLYSSLLSRHSTCFLGELLIKESSWITLFLIQRFIFMIEISIFLFNHPNFNCI